MFLHLNVVILTARDADRLQAISGQKRKQTLTRFKPTKTSGWYLYTRCWTQRVSIGCEPTLLELLQHRLIFFVLPRSSFGIRLLLTFSLLSLRQVRRQDSVTGGGRNKFWGGTRSLFCVNSKGARGHKKFIPVWIKGIRRGAKIQRNFPAEIGISSGFSGRKQVISNKKKKKKEGFIPKTSQKSV